MKYRQLLLMTFAVLIVFAAGTLAVGFTGRNLVMFNALNKAGAVYRVFSQNILFTIGLAILVAWGYTLSINEGVNNVKME